MRRSVSTYAEARQHLCGEASVHMRRRVSTYAEIICVSTYAEIIAAVAHVPSENGRPPLAEARSSQLWTDGRQGRR